jgi:dihydroorotase
MPKALLLLALASVLAQGQTYDLLLKGGHVIDPANNVDGRMDVAIAGGKIARVAPSITGAATRTIDAAGLYVTPGLIDLHAHVFGYSGSLPPDSTSLVNGTTTICDAGGAGWRTFEDFKKTVIDQAKTRVLVFLNIVGKGMVGSSAENDVEDMDPKLTAQKIRQYPGLIVGVKTAHYSRPGWAAVERAVEAGRLSNTPIIVDNNILSYTGRDTRTKLLEKLRPGDMHTHTYNDRHLEVIDRFSGKVTPVMWEARKRGVLFDLGHGSGSFLWPVATAAMKQGFPPDTISTDLHASSIMIPQSDMPNCISKLMNLGMTLQDAIARSTVAPAKAIHQFPALGTLTEGRVADVGIFGLRKGVFAFKDAWGKKMLGTQKLEAVFTVRDGKVVAERKRRGDAPGTVYDLVIKNGRQDVAVIGSKIARVGADIPAAHGRKVIEAAGYLVGGLTPEQARERPPVDPKGRPELAPLREGALADIALYEAERDGAFRCALIVRGGRVVWDTDGLSLTEWAETGPYSNYR